MRKVVTYYAFDDEEFFYYDDCLAYESARLGYMKELNECYSFFDKDMNKSVAPTSNDIEEWLDWVDNLSTADMVYFKKINSLSSEAVKFLTDYYGNDFYDINFNYELGLFKYNFNTDKWEKVE